MAVTARSLRSRPVRVLALLAALAAPRPAALAGQATPSATPPPVQSPPRTLSPKELREAQIAADTERLYQLAQQLKVELDKSNKDTLSLTVIKKAAEIEKLAHSIAERTKNN